MNETEGQVMIFRMMLLCVLLTFSLGAPADGIRSVSPGVPQQTIPPDSQQTQQTGKPSRKPVAGQTQQTRKSSTRNPNNQRVADLRQLRDELRNQAMSPIPANLSTPERAEARRYQAWLMRSAHKIDALARKGDAVIRRQAGMNRGQTVKTQREIQQMNENFSIQYLNLQNKLQQEVREYNLLSNIMKQKHEAAKNAINNIR